MSSGRKQRKQSRSQGRAKPVGVVSASSEAERVHAAVVEARALAEQFRMGEARGVLKELCRAVPRPEVHQVAGELLNQLRAPDQALACFEKAARLKGTLPATWVELAAAYERVHRLDEAEELLDRALHADENLRRAHLVRAKILRRRRDEEGAERELRLIIDQLPPSQELVRSAWGELAELRDAQGDYDGAIEAIEQCKRSQLDQGEEIWDRSVRGLKRFARMVESVKAEDFARWHEVGRNFSPERVAALTGFPRSGTTLLEQVLDAHPEVKSAEEWNYYPQRVLPELAEGQLPGVSLDRLLNRVDERWIGEQRRRFFEAAESFLEEPLDGRLHLDKNPALMMVVPVQLRIFPEMRLLIALRDPRDVVVSCYLRYLPLNVMSVHYLTLERAARRYALDMQLWLTMREMTKARFCEIRYEDTVADLAGQARRALETLGLPWDDRVLAYRERLTDKTVSSPSYQAVAQPVYKKAMGRWRNYEKHLAPVFDVLEPYLLAFGYE